MGNGGVVATRFAHSRLASCGVKGHHALPLAAIVRAQIEKIDTVKELISIRVGHAIVHDPAPVLPWGAHAHLRRDRRKPQKPPARRTIPTIRTPLLVRVRVTELVETVLVL